MDLSIESYCDLQNFSLSLTKCIERETHCDLCICKYIDVKWPGSLVQNIIWLKNVFSLLAMDPRVDSQLHIQSLVSCVDFCSIGHAPRPCKGDGMRWPTICHPPAIGLLG